MPLQNPPRCRFILSNIEENEIQDEAGYNIFEPTVSLELDGRSVPEELGTSGVEHVVIMHSLENFLTESLRMVHELDEKRE